MRQVTAVSVTAARAAQARVRRDRMMVSEVVLVALVSARPRERSMLTAAAEAQQFLCAQGSVLHLLCC